MTQAYMSLEQAIEYIQVNRLFLHYDNRTGIDVWSCGKPVSIRLRRAIVKYRRELLNMLMTGDARLCPAPELHKSRLRKTCKICRNLDASMFDISAQQKTA